MQDMARAEAEIAEVRARMARLAELVASGSFADALLECVVFPVVTRRALACTCTLFAHKVAEIFARPVLAMDDEDCTDANADFVFGPLLMANPGLQLATKGEVDGHYARWPVKQFIDGMERGHCNTVCTDRGRVRTSGGLGPCELLVDGEMSVVEAFFKGRCIAKMGEARIVVMWRDRRHPGIDQGYNPNPVRCTLFASQLRAKCNPQQLLNQDIVKHLTPSAWRVFAGCFRLAAEARVDDPMYLSDDQTRPHVKKIGLELSQLRLDKEGVRSVVAKLRANKHDLAHLDLSHTLTPISNGLFRPLVKGKISTEWLTSLDLSHNKYAETDIHRLAAHMKGGAFKELETLKMRNAGVNSKGLAALLDGMLLCNYKVLDFSENRGITDEGIWAFMNVGFELVQLRTLRLARLRNVRKERLIQFASWIRERSHWTEIKQVCVWESMQGPVNIRYLGYEADSLINAAVDCCKAEAAWAKAVARHWAREAQGHSVA